MLSKHESSHCKNILKLLDEDSLRSLKDTITKGVIVVSNSKETLNAIVEYSNNVIELLSRRKLKREVLLKYLIQEKVEIYPSANKEVLIQSVLDHIKSTDKTAKLKPRPFKSTSNTVCDEQSSIKKTAATIYCHQVGSNIAETDQQIAREFLSWFYPMLNSLGQNFQSSTAWSANHFWPECRLRCELPVDEQAGCQTFETHEGSELCAKRLASFVTDSHLVFNANDTPNGYRGRINEHGMAKVAVCGTVHRCGPMGTSNMFATFEQVFGLLRDPMDSNRWKIKFTDLSVQLMTDKEHSASCLSITSVNAIMQD